MPEAVLMPLVLSLQPDVQGAARQVAELAYSLASSRDMDGVAPDTEISSLAKSGLLHACLPPEFGGVSLGMNANTTRPLQLVLRTIGGASLPLGRLFEGHVNAVRLVTQFGTNDHMARLASEADAGRLSAVWNAQTGAGLTFDGKILTGRKVYCSGLGLVHRPVLTAEGPGGLIMMMPDVTRVLQDFSAWTPLGMRASLSGGGDFTGIKVNPAECIGQAGDYYRAPLFAGGAWRVLAVQLGGLEQLVALYRGVMHELGRVRDPVQRARFGAVAAQLETARIWVARCSTCAEKSDLDAGEIVALVNLARKAFEQAATAIILGVERGIGLAAMLRPHPVERIIRDLTTYLRQPALDAALDCAAVWTLAEQQTHRNIGDTP